MFIRAQSYKMFYKRKWGNAAFQDSNAGQAAAKTAAIEVEVKKNIGEQSQAEFKYA